MLMSWVLSNIIISLSALIYREGAYNERVQKLFGPNADGLGATQLSKFLFLVV